jgi:hypothetical protein
MKIFLMTLAILAWFPLGAMTAYEMGFMYETKSVKEFEDMESYLLYKIKESECIADHPVNRINSQHDMNKYIYFTGKAVAYRDCLQITND